MKIITMITLALVGLSACCAQTGQKQPAAQERPLTLQSPLLKDEFELFTVQEMGQPLAAHRYLLAKHDETELKIQTAAEFAPLVREITSPADALALVRLLTSQEIRPFLQDIFYSEVHKKSEPQAQAETTPEAQWFALEPEQYAQWGISEPVVTAEEESYKIERFVASYPRTQEQERTPAQLLKIWEWVDTEGQYSMEIQEVIAEGPEVRKILLFTK
ncbi:hypothetical protein GF339_11850 [candidate division KSB3 bacterium]|uniref:Lipoprotein n=1 Tax=candidate division KSB3 bacterium TaxID=2044937 RepID=A0A9D5Q6I1_9BACT|nr:hypothetical protein [candidate division KSB3 bacterium]MBD3325272.1 hypothetical protein [candidate division KSB3 bacterium]